MHVDQVLTLSQHMPGDRLGKQLRDRRPSAWEDAVEVRGVRLVERRILRQVGERNRIADRQREHAPGQGSRVQPAEKPPEDLYGQPLAAVQPGEDRQRGTVLLLEMLEEATAKTQRLRAEFGAEPKAKAIVKVLPGLVERYARDLRATLGRDTDRACLMLSRLLGDVILRPEKEGLCAEMRGDLRVLLEGAGYVDSVGAGRGI